MIKPDDKLISALLDALMLDWQDSGNISAEAVRDACIQMLSGLLGMSFADVVNLIEERARHKQ